VSWQGYAQAAALLAVLFASVKPLGGYMARVYEGEPIVLERALGWLERLIYRLAGVPRDVERREMHWTTYAAAMLLFNGAGILLVYAMERLQGVLPLNPQGFAAPTPDLSWNTAVSFATNTDWQSYGGETTMSYLTQMTGLAVQNFVCAASGMAVMSRLSAASPERARRHSETSGSI
jgi:potassium-transporting ATPase potassium-binding subunit